MKKQTYLWLVMDGRAAYDVDAASIMETWGEFADQPSMKKLRKSWGAHGCTLCRALVVNEDKIDPIEFVCEIP